MQSDPFPNLLFPSCAQCAGIGIEQIPEFLWALEDELGFDTLRVFLLAHGGRRCDIQKRDGSKVIDELDRLGQAYAFTRSYWGHGRIAIPLGPAARRARAAWTAFEHLKQGQSLQTVARLIGCNERQVSRQKAKFIEIGALNITRKEIA